MTDVLTDLRAAAAEVAGRARHVRVNAAAIPDYAAALAQPDPPAGDEAPRGDRELKAALWLTLDAINFGSGWFPTLNKRPGGSGYQTIAAGIEERFAARGPWTAQELQRVTATDIADALSQDPDHPLMHLFAQSLHDLGHHVDGAGSFTAIVDAARGSALSLVETLATWSCFADVSTYDELRLPFLKRAQIAAADLARAGAAQFRDLDRLTMFADNLVPHVLRLDGILGFDPGLTDRIDRQQLIEHGSREEIEIRACAVHAVELIVAARPDSSAAQTDQLLWLRGQQPVYKARPRHRSRTTAY